MVMFDKGRRPGGRTSTRRVEVGGLQLDFDHGAQYFTLRDADIARVVAAWEALGVVQRWRGRIVAIQEDGSVRTSESEARFVGTPTMSAVCEHLASGLQLHCGVTVSAIERSAVGLALSASDGRRLGRFDAVVLTAPPPQTAALAAYAAPALAARIASVTMKPCWAAMVAFDSAYAAPFDAAFVNRGPLSWVARASSKPRRSAKPDRWVLHANDAWSAAHLEQGREEVSEALLRAFFEAASCGAAKPVWLSAHRWRFAAADAALDDGCLVDAPGRVIACGDWANGNRVEGALLSGRIAAQRLDELLS
jgi:renalase